MAVTRDDSEVFKRKHSEWAALSLGNPYRELFLTENDHPEFSALDRKAS